MIKVKFTLYKWDTYKDGTSPLFIECSLNRKRTFIKTNVNCTIADWDDKRNLLKKSFPNSAQLNTILTKQLNDVTAIALASDSLQQLKDTYNGVKPIEVSHLLTDYIQTIYDECIAQNRHSSAAITKDLKAVITKFKADTNICDLNYKYIVDLTTSLRERGCGTNGIGIRLRTLRTINNRLINEGLTTEYAFKNYCYFQISKR